MIKIEGVRLSSITCCVPNSYEDNLLVPNFSDERKGKIIAGTGVRSRYVADERTCASDLATEAAKQIILNSKLELEQVGVLLFATQSPDFILPATSYVIHKALKLVPMTITFDINLGCSAYVYGLYVASCLLKSTGKQYALLLVGDTMSRYVSPEDASTKFLFGDAGSATLLEIDETAEPMYFTLGSDGTGWQNLIIPAGGARNKKTDTTSALNQDHDGNIRSAEHLYMDGMEIFNFTISTVVPHIQQVIDEKGMPDVTVFHQANRYMLEFMRKSLKIPRERFLYSLEKYGNTSSASIPVTLCSEYKDKRYGPKVLLSGFGVGYSWGSVILDVNKTKMYDIKHLGVPYA